MTLAEEWFERGRQEGRQEGKARALLNLIERKFGPEARAAYQARIEDASADEFEVWVDRILDAERIEELFWEA